MPFLDIAYQGFGDGIDEDAFAVRALRGRRRRASFFVANSFSKSFSLYGERCGAPERGLPRRGRGRARARPAQARCAPTTPARRPTAARWSPHVLGDAGPARGLGAGAGGMRERIKAMREELHAVLRRQAAGARLRLLPHASAACSATPGWSGAGGPPARASSASTWCARAACAWPGLNTGNVEATGHGDGGGARRLSRSAAEAARRMQRRGRWRRSRNGRRAPAVACGKALQPLREQAQAGRAAGEVQGVDAVGAGRPDRGLARRADDAFEVGVDALPCACARRSALAKPASTGSRSIGAAPPAATAILASSARASSSWPRRSVTTVISRRCWRASA